MDLPPLSIVKGPVGYLYWRVLYSVLISPLELMEVVCFCVCWAVQAVTGAKSKPLKSLQCLGFSKMFAADVLRQLQGYLKRASERIRKLQLALNVFREIEGMTRFLMALL